MSPSEETIFLEALSFTASDAREEFLLNACQGQPGLLTNIRALLDGYARGEFLEHTLSAVANMRLQAMSDSPIKMIGPYHIRELIGRGGMGSVYMAEQLQPVRRKVAVKVIRPGLDNQDVIRRFHQEQRTLAMMDHPCIARVLDASITESGISYFVMELVSGIPILEYCETAAIDIEQRLRLFSDCCHAIQHAHQKGVIHRDIKPSNVLVTVLDQKPVIKVIDFGIAKAFEGEAAEKTSSGRTYITQLGEFLGTPQYMSPEQASMGEIPIDTRSDIYSLGTLLYAMLTGVPPFDTARIKRATFDEIRQIIRDEDPVLPSVRIRQRKTDGDTLLTNDSTHRRLVSQLNGDLDCIVMKAMEKVPDRRYQSVGELIDDVQCFLESKPIQARPPSTLYTLSKLARRRQGVLISVALATTCLLTGLVFAIMQARRAIGAEQRMANLLYAADMRVATQATINRDSVVAREALTRQLPGSGNEDRRSFDWHFLNARNKIETRDLLKTGKPLYHLCRLNGTTQVACCGEEGIIRILDEIDGKLLHTIVAGQGEVNGVASSPDGSLLASAGDDGTIALWNAKRGELTTRFKAHQRQAFQVAWSPDGTQLATCGNENDVHVWSATDFQRLCTFPTEHDLEYLAVSVNGDLAFGMEGGSVALTHFPRVSGELPVVMTMPAESDEHCAALAFSPNGRLLASGALSGKVTLHTVPDLKRVRQISLADAVNALTISADHRSCVAGLRNGAVFVVDLSDLQNIDSTLIEPHQNHDQQQSANSVPTAMESSMSVVRYCADGALDPTFGEDGIVTIRVLLGDHFVSRVTTQRDGKILVSGSARNSEGNLDITVLRLDRDGSPDSTFGVGGKVIISTGRFDDGSETMVIQEDEKILIGGFTNNGSNNDIFVLRLNPDGTTDNSFGIQGKVIKAIGASNEVCRSVALQSDGKILVGGESAGATTDMFVLRLNRDGTIDSTFDNDGLQTADFGSTDMISAVAVQSDGKIIGGGYAYNGTDYDFAMIRLNGDGSFDATFDSDGNNDGKILSAVGGSTDDTALGLLILPDGKLVMGGKMTASSGDQFAVVRYNRDGSLDPTFDGDGRQTSSVQGGCNVFGLAMQSDGKTIQSGWVNDGRHQQFAVVRYTVEGSLDASFDGDGIVTTATGTGDSPGYWTAVQSDGKLVVVGTSSRPITSAVVSKSAPTDVAISLADEFEGKAVGSVIGTFATCDPDPSNTFRYTLVDGTGSTGNAKFRILGDTLTNAVLLDDQKSDYSIRVRTTDQTGLSFERVFTIPAYDNRPGALDRTFDGDGIVTTPIGTSDDLGRSVVIQSDGKILVTGESYNGSHNVFGVARFRPNGTLDTSFGVGGKAVVEFDGQRADSTRVAIQNVEVNGVIEERIILAGYKLAGDTYDFAMVRLLPAGKLDTAFGDLGKCITPVVSSDDTIFALAIQPDGKVLAGGFSTSVSDNDFALARYDINGTLDPAFQNDSSPVPGIVITNLGLDAGQPNDSANDIILQGDKIILAGYSIAGGANDFSAVRYLSNGAIDTTFGGSGTGILNTPFTAGSADSATSIGIGPDGKIVLGGYSKTGARSVFALTRYSADGILDNTFDADGKVTTPISDLDDGISDIEIQPDGKIVAVGYTRPASTGRYSMQMVRYNVDGSLDSSFDGDGKRTFTLGTNHSVLTRLSIQPDGRVVATGYSHNGDNSDFTMIRCLADSSPSNGLASKGPLQGNTSNFAVFSDHLEPPHWDSGITKSPLRATDFDHSSSAGTAFLTSLSSVDDRAIALSHPETLNPLDEDLFVEIREPAATRDVHSLSIHQASVASLCFSSSGDELLSVGEDGSLKSSIISSNISIQQVADSVQSFDFLNDRQLLVEESKPNVSHVTKVISLSHAFDTELFPSPVLSSAWWPKIAHGTGTLYSQVSSLHEQTQGVMKWSADLEQYTLLWPRPHSTEAMQYHNPYAISPDEQFLAVVAEKFDGQQELPDHELLIWDLGHDRPTGRHPCGYPYALGFSPDSEIVAIMDSSLLTLINASNGKLIYNLRGKDFRDFAFSPDGSEIAIVSEDRKLRRLSIKNCTDIASVEAHEVAARGVAYTPDGLTIGTVGTDGYFRCWRVAVMEPTMELPLGTPLMQLKFSPDGQTAAIQDREGRVFLLSTEAGRPSTGR